MYNSLEFQRLKCALESFKFKAMLNYKLVDVVIDGSLSGETVGLSRQRFKKWPAILE